MTVSWSKPVSWPLSKTLISDDVWPPQAGGVGIGVSLLSYAGRITVGVSADIRLMVDPQRLIDAFSLELDRLLSPRAQDAERWPAS